MAQVISAEPAQSCYLYAVAERLPRRWRPPIRGVDAAPVVARLLGDLVVIASMVDAVPRPTRGALARHDEVVSATLAADAVLPLPFGTVVPAPDVDEWLASHLALIRTCLPRLRRHVEMTIRLVSLSPGANAQQSLRDVAERLVERARISDWCARDDRSDGLAVALAFLVPRDGIGDFLARVAPVAARAGAVAVVPTGPYAPASFAPRLALSPRFDDREPLARAG
jgi:hypothetical protein